MKYLSTRNKNLSASSSMCILEGLSKEGGLFFFDSIPSLDLNECLKMNYLELAIEVLKKFLTDFSEEEISACVHNAYDDSFDTEEITPIVKVKEDWILELFHGPTSAFKDVALQILPHLLTTSLKIQKSDQKILILTATSGDTGKAALEGFKDVENVKIMVFYPKDGVSEIQKKQMVTTKGNNCYVLGVDGNFDDCQKAVKQCFTDEDLINILSDHNTQFSSANSINVGRLLPQIVYYVKSYLDLVRRHEIEMNEKINVSVPTGNFGNILAGYIAKQMGVPIEKFICASNENNVLTEFIQTGIYNANRTFVKTNSPSMDIVVSSNLERLLYWLSQDDALTAQMMTSLKEKGQYEISSSMKEKLQKEFYASCVTQKETEEMIQKVYEENHYLMDPHTAVAYKALLDFKKENINSYKTVVCATASPYKFMDTVMKSIDSTSEDEFEMMERCEKLTNVMIPKNLKNLKDETVRHHKNISIDEIKEEVIRVVSHD